MSELERILHAYQGASAAGRVAALASVVSVSGSTYRRIGAHMLVTEDGEVTGAVSGGCLERDICRHAVWVMQSGQAKRLVYNPTDDDDTEGAFALGCNGVVEILVERLLPDDAYHARKDLRGIYARTRISFLQFDGRAPSMSSASAIFSISVLPSPR